MSIVSILTAFQVTLAIILVTSVIGLMAAAVVAHAETCHTSCNTFGKFTQCTTTCDDEGE